MTAADESERLQRAVELILTKTNKFRDRHDLAPVKENSDLTEAATYFAKFMARTGKYGHTADDQRPAERAVDHGYQFCIVSENLGYAFQSTGFTVEQLTDRLVDGWIESKGHRENMLGEYVSDIGISVARDDETQYYFAVQMFGRPESQHVKFTVRNESEQEVAYQVVTDGEQKTLTLPPRMIVRHTRCRPPKVKLKESQAWLEVQPSDTLIVRTSEETVSLERASSQDPTE